MSRKPNPWVQHVKEQAAKLGVSYPCAISLAEVKESYRKKAFEPLGKKPKSKSKKETSTPKLKIAKKDKLAVEGPSLDQELENIEIQDKQEKRKKMAKDIRKEIEKKKPSKVDRDIVQKVRSGDPKALKQIYAAKNIAENIASSTISRAFRNRTQRK